MLKNTFVIYLMISLMALLNSEGYCQKGQLIRITNQNDVKSFAYNAVPGITSIWKVKKFNRKVFEASIVSYKNKMMKTLIQEYGTYVESGLNFVVKHLSEYNIEYSGIVADNKQLIICQMLSADRDDIKNGEADSFSSIVDGGFSILTVLYDPETKTVISLSWHGVA